jgi:hypothetical protein
LARRASFDALFLCTVLLSEIQAALHFLFTQFCRQNAVDATLGKKWQRWIVLRRTAIVATFLLAEAGIRIITIKQKG